MLRMAFFARIIICAQVAQGEMSVDSLQAD